MATNLRLLAQRSSNETDSNEVDDILSSSELSQELSTGLSETNGLLVSVSLDENIDLRNDVSELWEEQTKTTCMSPFNSSDQIALRKSERSCKKRIFSSEDRVGAFTHLKKRKRKIKRAALLQQKSANVIPPDKGPNGEPFCCDRCKSPYICNPSRKANQLKQSKHTPSARHKLDPVTNKILTLCNACGLAFDRQRRPRKEKPLPSFEEKEKYLIEAKTFALSLVDGLRDKDAERLACPHYKSKACACIQRYIVGDGQMEESRKRASELLNLLKEAKRLAALKFYNIEEVRTTSGHKKRVKNIGLGNGQKKSKAFEHFVLENRKYLRDDLKLCERATQKVLMYSNNFLHKKLKTDPQRGPRIDRQKGKAALGLLIPISELIKEQCCVDNCIMMALTHSRLLQQWRSRSIAGQTDARRVLAEMLTPSGGARSNCYKFISMITGCSYSTIGRVNEQMKRTGGEREPPQHGLKKWWQDHPKNHSKHMQQDTQAPIVSNSKGDTTLQQYESDLEADEQSSPGSNQVQAQQQEVLQLQRQIAQQQLQIQQQQQQLLQHQILQQNLLQQMVNNNPAATQSLQQLLQGLLQQHTNEPDDLKTITFASGNTNTSSKNLPSTSNKDSSLDNQNIQHIIVDLITSPVDSQTNPSTINLNTSTVPQLNGDLNSVGSNINIALLRQQLAANLANQEGIINDSVVPQILNGTNNALGYTVLIQQQGNRDTSVINIQTPVENTTNSNNSPTNTLSTEQVLSQSNSQDLNTQLNMSNEINRSESFISSDTLHIFTQQRALDNALTIVPQPRQSK